ncbi:MAG: glycosyltransferase [Chlorobiaceae bacterium]|nr:glycosyltransferase [Chlorobiaceae bacterium]NTW75089.1 glycosyltransferase [Chlorobiaceae bacterium]
MNFLFLNSARRGWGGNERSIQIVAHALSESHHVVLAYRDGIVGDHFDIPKYRLPFLFEGDLATIMGLVSIVRKHGIEVLVPTKRKDYALAGIVSRICGVCNVLWLGATRELGRSPVNNLVYNRLADGMIVNARRIKESLLTSPFMRADRIAVIYNGLDMVSLDVERSVPVPEHAGVRIASMGRLDDNKGHDLLIRGFARLLTMAPDLQAELLIIGDGPRRGALEELAAGLKISSRVKFAGFQKNPYPLLRQSDIFAMTSKIEGLSIALLEAMYLDNVPVSTLAGGGVREIVSDGENGFLVGDGNEEMLASVLLRLCREPELRSKLAARAHASVAERYSLGQVTRNVAGFCGSICRGRGQGS